MPIPGTFPPRKPAETPAKPGAFFDSENDFFHATTKFSVPDGTYWAIGTFFSNAGFRPDVLPQFTVHGNTTRQVREKANALFGTPPRPAATITCASQKGLRRAHGDGHPGRHGGVLTGAPARECPAAATAGCSTLWVWITALWDTAAAWSPASR